jgi:tetratricopeptide (TPR) repeat protein/TolB-like protein
MQSSPEHDNRVMTVLAKFLRQPPAERDSYLEVACADDENLRHEVAETVAWEERMGDFLLKPVLTLKDFARPFHTGQVVAQRFEILREIGDGGMGVVYESFDRKRKQKIAIKAAKPGFQRLLSPELEGALKVRHPNICLVNEIHTAQTEQGEIDFLTMELLHGETLSNRLSAQGKLAPAQALEVARQLCAGLAEAHRSGIIHRDLKSANVILSKAEDGGMRAVITDFGLAGALTQSGDTAGTPGYMAPELWRSGGKTTKASDIYSLGVILYETVTGHRPFDSAKSILAGRPAAPTALVKGLDPAWDRVILRCLHVSPDARPASASEITAGLEKTPRQKAPLLVLVMVLVGLITTVAFVPSFRQRVEDFVWPPTNVRLAVLPFDGPQEAALGGGVLHDVSDRISHLRNGRRTVVVIPSSEALRDHVQTADQARKVLHATHALQTSVHREGDEFVAQASVLDLGTDTHVRDFSGHYSAATIGSLPAALAGAVSVALRLQGTPVQESLSPAATAPYDRGLYLVREDRHKFEDAIALFQEAIRLDPRSALPLAGLAEAQIAKFQFTKQESAIGDAQKALREAESINPDSVRVRLAAGLLNETAGQYEKAMEDYRRVQDLEPRNMDALLRIGHVYGPDGLDLPDKAIAAYQKAIDLDPAYYATYEELGEFYFFKGRYPEAAENFQKTIERAPGIAYAHTNLGAVLSDMGNYADADQAFRDSLNLEETARALNSIGANEQYQNRDAEAAGYLERAVALDPGDYVFWLNLADSDRRLGRTAKANAAYHKAMDLALVEIMENPKLGYPRGFVAYFAAELGDKQRAEQEIRQALQLSPGDKKVIRRAVFTYEVLGQRDNAIATLAGATPDLLREMNREPDLADFCQDIRFRHLVEKIANGG